MLPVDSETKIPQSAKLGNFNINFIVFYYNKNHYKI